MPLALKLGLSRKILWGVCKVLRECSLRRHADGGLEEEDDDQCPYTHNT